MAEPTPGDRPDPGTSDVVTPEDPRETAPILRPEAVDSHVHRHVEGSADTCRAIGIDAAVLDGADQAMRQLVDEIVSVLTPGFRQIAWAEAEIERAGTEHPDHRDVLFHAFGLLRPTADAMTTEFVYRSHCRELLERVVAGDDTRVPTNAEIAVACSLASLEGPLTTAAVTVYMRAWARAFPDKLDVFGDAVDPYEYVAGAYADDLERNLRRRLTIKDRTLRDVSCSGRHHDEPAPQCRYYTPEQLDLPLRDDP